MAKTKIRFEDLEQGLTAPIAITSNSVNAVSIDGDTFSVDALNNRIGIGTTTPSYALDVRNGDVYAHNGSFLLSGYSGTSISNNFGKEYLGRIIAGMEIENTTLGGNYSQKLHFRTHYFGTSEGRSMTISESGNVGIGTVAPTQKLQISGGSTMIDVNQSHYLGGQTDLGIDGTRLVSTGGDTYVDNKGTGSIHFRNDNIFGATDRMVILNNGNVGIGTTAPTTKLQVVGLPSYADNATAISNGLTVGAFYHTAGTLKVVI